MRILLVWSAADVSTYDVSIGYNNALRTLGHDVHPFMLNRRLEFWSEALVHWAALQSPPQPEPTLDAIMREASVWVLIEAAKFQADLILVTSSMGFHPDAYVLLRQHGYKTGVIFTESPYNDEDQLYIAPLVDFLFTNDLRSVPILAGGNSNVTYLPTAYNSDLHKPGLDPAGMGFANPYTDVLFVGTGFPERMKLLADAVSIVASRPGQPPRVGLYGVFNFDPNDPPVADILTPLLHDAITNDETAARYCGARIVLNFYRTGAGYSLNPRAYEIAACGAFQLAQDSVEEAHSVFGNSIAYFTTPEDLARQITYYLDPDHALERLEMAAEAHLRVQGQTYLNRAERLLEVINGDDAFSMGASQVDPAVLSFGRPVTYSSL